MPYFQLEKNLNLYYEDKGEGVPILFVHGWTSNNWMWFNQVDYFAERYRVITIDLKGHGASDKPEAEYLMKDFALELDRFVSNVIGKEKFVLVGHSMGGMIVLTYAVNRQRAAKLKALVPCGTTFKMGNPILSRFVDQLKQGILKYNQATLGMMSKLAYNGKFAREHKEIIQRNTEEGLKCPDYVGIACMDAFVNKYDIEKDLPSISVPTLILAGDKDAMVSPDNSERMQSLIPNASLKIIGPQVGHCLQIERPLEFNTAIDEFIQSVG